MKYLGLDLSLNGTGWHILDGVNSVGGVLNTPAKLRGAARLQWLETAFAQVLATHITDPAGVRVCIEDYVCGVNPKTVFGMAEWGGIVRLTLHKAGIVYDTISNTSLKQFVTGDGSSKKDRMMLSLFKTWGWEFKENDQADACGLALVAEAIHGTARVALNAVQKKAISRVVQGGDAPSKPVKITTRRKKSSTAK